MDRFAKDGERIELPLQGHRTLFTDRGKNGSLFAVVRIVEEIDRWREGSDILSRHMISLSDAVQGCSVPIMTVHGSQSVTLKPRATQSRFVISDNGAATEKKQEDEEEDAA